MKELGPLSDLAPHFPYASGALAPLRVAAEKAGTVASLRSGLGRMYRAAGIFPLAS